MQSCPLDAAWLAWSRIMVSASSCRAHNSSTLLLSIPFSPAVSLWHSIPWVTNSEPESATLTKYSGFCHSCTRKDARFALLLPSLRYFFHWVGHFWLPWLIAIWMIPPAPRRSLSLGSWWIHQDTDPWSGQSWSCPGTPPISRAGRHNWLDYWMSLVHLSWNAI